jgi:hypothetical protein
MAQDAVDDVGVGNKGDDAHPGATGAESQRIILEYFPNLKRAEHSCPARGAFVRARLLLRACPLPVVLVGRTGRGNAAGDLRPGGMCLGQCTGQGDAGAGDLRASRVRRLERRRDGDCGAAAASARERNLHRVALL